MRSGLRAGAVALALVASSYGIVAATHQSAAAAPPAAVPRQPVQEPPAEVTAVDTKTTLPAGSVADVLVDDVNQQVFISMPSTNSVVVTTLDGTITATITGLTKPSDMTMTADNSAVYVAEAGTHAIGKIDSQSHAVAHIAVPDTDCVSSVAFTGGKLWYSYAACPSTISGGIGVFDPATETVTSGVFEAEPGSLRALPDRPDRLVQLSEHVLGVYNVGADTPVVVTTKGFNSDTRANCRDAGLAAGGDLVITACAIPYRHEVFQTSDLSSAPAIETEVWPNSVAVSEDGRFVAAGVANGHSPEIYVHDVQGGTPGPRRRTYDFPGQSDLIPDTLEFSASGRLYAVEDPGNSANPVLHVLDRATTFDTSVEITAPRAVKYQGTVNATGMLQKGPGSATVATLTRIDRAGTHELGTIPVAADGTFSFTDTPAVTGPATYQVGYAGDDDHAPAIGTHTVIMRPLPYDINADGYAETIVGVPGENIGSDSNTGMFHVLPGTASGAAGSGSRSYHQDTPGVPGGNEDGDLLGYSNASGDFNGDGYADVAVSVGAEDVGSIKDNGVVLVFYGSASGLRTDNVKSLTLRYTELSDISYVYFGDALAAGDFDGDGRDDLAIGAAYSYSGSVFVAPGTSSGLATTYTEFNSGTSGMPGTVNKSELFGWSVATGDVNGDGNADLAIGAIFDWEDKDWSTGSVNLLYGGETGLTTTGAQRFSKETPGVPGGGGSFNEDKGDVSDQFGNAVALADFNGDGKADLAVAAAGSPTTGVDGKRKADAGTVTVLYSDGSKIATTEAIQVTQKTSGVPGNPGANDFFGATMNAGDANGDGKYELAIFSPGDTYVTVVPGASSGLAWGSAKGWTQNSSGIPGSSESGDYWGNSLRFADIKGTGHMALIVGADGENSGKGAITVIYSTGSGLTGTGAKYFSQNSTGISGTAENGDGFGTFY